MTAQGCRLRELAFPFVCFAFVYSRTSRSQGRRTPSNTGYLCVPGPISLNIKKNSHPCLDSSLPVFYLVQSTVRAPGIVLTVNTILGGTLTLQNLHQVFGEGRKMYRYQYGAVLVFVRFVSVLLQYEYRYSIVPVRVLLVLVPVDYRLYRVLHNSLPTYLVDYSTGTVRVLKSVVQ